MVLACMTASICKISRKLIRGLPSLSREWTKRPRKEVIEALFEDLEALPLVGDPNRCCED